MDPWSTRRAIAVCVKPRYCRGIVEEISWDLLDLPVLSALFLYFLKALSRAVKMWLNIISMSVINLPKFATTWKTWILP